MPRGILNFQSMQNSRFLFLVGLLVVSLMACDSEESTKQLFLAHTLPTTHPVHQGMVDFQRLVAEKSGGKLAVQIFPDGQLGGEREVIELLQIGSLAMTKVSAAVLANFAPAYEVLGAPYLFRDKEHLFRVLEGSIGQQLLNSSREYWLKGLCFYDAGSRSFYTVNQPVRTPEDLTGLKIRTMNHQMSVEMVNRLGGSATPMAYGELYTALQQGVVDGAENNPPSYVSSNHFEVAKYYSLDEHTLIPDVLIASTKFWDRLSPEEQQWVQEAATESVVSQKRYWNESVEACMEKLEAAGVEVIRPDKSLFADKTSEILQQLRQDPEQRALVEAIQKQP